MTDWLKEECDALAGNTWRNCTLTSQRIDTLVEVVEDMELGLPPPYLGVEVGGFESIKCNILYLYNFLKERMSNIGITEKGCGGKNFANPPHLMKWNPSIKIFVTFLPEFRF